MKPITVTTKTWLTARGKPWFGDHNLRMLKKDIADGKIITLQQIYERYKVANKYRAQIIELLKNAKSKTTSNI